eukprot:g1840.t1
MQKSARPIYNSISRKLRSTFLEAAKSGSSAGINSSELTNNPSKTVIEIENESYMHNVPKNSETHFKVSVVSSHFEGMRQIQRHRMINSLLADELKSGVHALSISALTPEEFEKKGGSFSNPSPKCHGGGHGAGPR